jgi:hypothetical protein
LAAVPPTGAPGLCNDSPVNIAESSLAETEYLLILSTDLDYLPPDQSDPVTPTVDRRLSTVD